MIHRIAISLALLAALLIVVPVQASASGLGEHCRDVSVPVSLAAGQPARYQLSGRLCTPAARSAATVQVLLHGLNYSHVYWDFPLQPNRYSYVRWANRAGYATFNLDRIGVGHSSHPPSGEVTLESNAFTIHQVVAALRGGSVLGRAFGNVVLVGHSYGSEIAKLEASSYGDVDALVLTGSAHHVSPSGAARLAQFAEHAAADPRLAAEVPPGDDGYVTLQDASRPEVMYNLPAADPRVIARDVATKETNTLGEIFTIGDANAPGVTDHLSIPLLIVNGTADQLACAPDATDCATAATLRAAEQPFYPRTRVDAIVVPDLGHVINLHRDAPAAYLGIIGWLNRNVGR
jgi:pimeloyl-ACP methyl ester carboxylesterase